MRVHLALALAVLITGCLTPSTSTPPVEHDVLDQEADAPDGEPDGAETPPTPSPAPRSPPTRPPDAFGLVAYFLPAPENSSVVSLTVLAESASGNRTPIRHGLNGTSYFLEWDVTTATYADRNDLIAALGARTDEWQDAFTFSIASAGTGFRKDWNLSKLTTPTKSIVIESPHATTFIAITLPDGAVYIQETATVPVDNQGRTEWRDVTAWSRYDYGSVHAEGAEEDRATTDGEAAPE